MFRQAVLGGHEYRPCGASIAHFETDDIAIKSHGAFYVAGVNPDMAEGSDFRHKPSLLRRLLVSPWGDVNGETAGSDSEN
jgi:hypothetical protein